jgi:hypothetical protein
VFPQKSHAKFLASAHLIDASINSFNSLGSLIRKENYRNKITSLNNPASAELGFNLEIEIQAALKPILEKATPLELYNHSKYPYTAALFGEVNEIEINGKMQLIYPNQ